MEIVRWEGRPRLRKPVLVAAFEGWNDAGDAASTAAHYMAVAWGADRFATIDPEEFYDFTATRPQVRMVDEGARRIEWPTNEWAAASLPGPRDVLFLHGTEPQLRWRTFCATVLGVARATGAEMVVTLGSLLTDTPHTRPVPLTGTAGPELAGRLGVRRSRYEGPTGIVGVLHDACARADLPSASLWAAVPHYVGQVPSPKAALALVERASAILEAPVDTSELRDAAEAYERQVTEQVEDDENALAYVRQLEEAADEDDEEPIPFPTQDALAAEVERFLREQHRD
jgi:predicted ATP-grasp superfamily ATP-dependent carboligase